MVNREESDFVGKVEIMGGTSYNIILGEGKLVAQSHSIGMSLKNIVPHKWGK